MWRAPPLTRLPRVGDPRDIELRNAALEHVHELQPRDDDLVPAQALAEGFQFRARRVSFGAFHLGAATNLLQNRTNR